MKVFLTGGTGYIGAAVGDALAAAKHSVLALARSDDSAAKLAAKGYEVYRGDVKAPESLTEGAKQCDGVIHTAMAVTAQPGNTDAAAVGAMIEGLKGTGKPFVYTSGVWVMGDTGGRLAGEWSPLHPAPLVSWRPAVERLVLDAREFNVRSVVIRPAIVYGRGGGLVSAFVRSARVRGAARFAGTGENHWSFVHVEDLADLYVRALERSPAGELYLGVSHRPVRVRDVAEAASLAAGMEGRVEAWPIEQARKEWGPVADALALDQRIGTTKPGRMLGWIPRALSVIDELAAGGYSPS